jgi:hypothetical protein
LGRRNRRSAPACVCGSCERASALPEQPASACILEQRQRGHETMRPGGFTFLGTSSCFWDITATHSAAVPAPPCAQPMRPPHASAGTHMHPASNGGQPGLSGPWRVAALMHLRVLCCAEQRSEAARGRNGQRQRLPELEPKMHTVSHRVLGSVVIARDDARQGIAPGVGMSAAVQNELKRAGDTSASTVSLMKDKKVSSHRFPRPHQPPRPIPQAP